MYVVGFASRVAVLYLRTFGFGFSLSFHFLSDIFRFVASIPLMADDLIRTALSARPASASPLHPAPAASPVRRPGAPSRPHQARVVRTGTPSGHQVRIGTAWPFSNHSPPSSGIRVPFPPLRRLNSRALTRPCVIFLSTGCIDRRVCPSGPSRFLTVFTVRFLTASSGPQPPQPTWVSLW